MGMEHHLAVLLPERFETEGITNSVLQEFVDKLDLRRIQVLEALYAQLQDHYTHDRELSGEDVDSVAEVLQQVEGMEDAPGAEIATLARERASVLRRIAEAEAAAASIGILANAQQQLATFDAHLTAGAFCEAADDAAGLAAACEEHAELRAQGLQRAYDERMQALLEALEHDVAERVTADPSRSQLRVATGGDAGDAWRALGILGGLDSQLKRLSGVLMNGLVAPLLAAHGPLRVTSSEGWFGNGPAAVLEWAEEGPMTPRRGNSEPGLLEAALLQSLRFISRHAFQGEEVLAVQLGRHLWKSLSDAYIESHLSRMLPKDDSQIDSFRAAASAARRFEADAAAMGYVPLEEDGQGPIRGYVQQCLDEFLHKKRLAALAKARDLLVSPISELISVGIELPVNQEALAQARAREGDSAASALQTGDSGESGESARGPSRHGGADLPLNWGPEGEEGPLLASGQYKITGTAAQLVALLREVVGEAASCGSPALAQSMCAAACDMAHLLIAMPPVIRGPELQLPQGAALYHNDCRHIAAELLALPLVYDPGLSRVAPSAAAQFIFSALELRSAAQVALSDQTKRLQAEMAEVIAGADRFRRIREAQRGITARRVTQQALAALRRMGDVLGGVLPPREFVAVAASILESLTERIAGDLLELADISVEESEELPRILAPLAAEAVSAAVGQTAQSDDTSAPDREVLIKAVEAGAPSLGKLREVLDLMTARLAVFRERWESGRLPALGFTRRQAIHLVEALFEDTDLRRSTLAALRNG